MRYGQELTELKSGDPLYAEDYSALVRQVNKLTSLYAGGQEGFVANAAGIFPIPKKHDDRRYELTEALYRTSSATADELYWDGSDWQTTGVEKTIYGDFSTGYWFSGDNVWAVPRAGRFYAVGCGHVLVRGTLDGALASGSTATLSVTTVNGSGSWTDAGINVTVNEDVGLDDPVDAGDVVMATWHEQLQGWIATHAPCPTSGSA